MQSQAKAQRLVFIFGNLAINAATECYFAAQDYAETEVAKNEATIYWYEVKTEVVKIIVNQTPNLQFVKTIE